MRIDERIAAGAEPCFSFEFFPPKTPDGEANLERALAELSRLEPTFVSVTYGAAGSPEQRERTIEIVSRIKADHGLEAMAHFTLDGGRAAGDARSHARRRDRERARPARRPAGRARGVGRHRGRPALLA
jgi:5,10-methylenetetrahydrofolate reductase